MYDPTLDQPYYDSTDPMPANGGGSTAPAQPSGNTFGTSALPYTGKASAALIEALYPGYTLQNGQIVWKGQGNPTSQFDPTQTTNYLNSLADPLAAGNYQQFFQTLYNGANARQELLTGGTLSNALKAAGFNVTPANKAGQISKVQTPGSSGQNGWVRVIEGDPLKGGNWTWVPQGADSGGGAGVPGGGGFAIDPSYLSAWDRPFQFPEFQAPNESDLRADPSYLWRRNNAVGAYENSAAAKGLLNSSNAPYDIGTLADSLASQEYSNVFARKFGTWQNARDNAYQQYTGDKDTFYRNQNEPFNKLFSLSNLGYNAAIQ